MMGKKNIDIDEAVIGLLQKVAEKKAQIKASSQKPNWLTNVTFGYNPETPERINIMTVTNQQKLVDIYSFLLSKEERYEQSCAELGLGDDKLLYMGYSFDDWKADLKTRAGQLLLEKRKQELDVLDKRVNSLVTAEQRREMELEALQREMGV